MKTINLLVVIFIMSIVCASAGNKETIIEKIEKATIIKVFFYDGNISVKQSDPSPATPMYPEEVEACKVKIDAIDLPEGYNSVQELIVAELNKSFGVTKFALGAMGDVPKKTVKILGSDTEVEDWNTLEDKFVVICTMEGSYKGSSYSRNDEGKLLVNSYYEVIANAKFCEIIEEKQPIKYLTPMGVSLSAKSENFKQEGCFSEMAKFTEIAAPESLIEPLKNSVAGSFDKFVTKQKKKYEKAMKKKK